MKILRLLFLAMLLVACSSTKQVTKSTSSDTVIYSSNDTLLKKAVETVKVNSIVEPHKNLINKTVNTNKDSIYFIKKATHNTWNELLKKHVSEEGTVNYLAFKSDRDKLLDYINYLGNNMPLEQWQKHDILAYWINAYNAMTIDLILRHYPVKSIKDINDPWKQRYWKLGDKWYNLDDIEHNILRKMDEPRIHFAIVCASYSCPKLQNKVFTASNLDVQLTQATKAFLNDSERNSITKDTLELSKIFQWFGKDFKKNGSLIDFLNQYSEIEISDKAKIKYKDYDWALNE